MLKFPIYNCLIKCTQTVYSINRISYFNKTFYFIETLTAIYIFSTVFD